MAEGKEIVIRIINENGASTSASQTDVIGNQSKKSSEEYLNTAVMSSLLSRAASQAKNLIVNEAKYEIDLHYNLTDNYLGQQNMNIALSIFNKVVGFGESVVVGAKVGSVGGVVGAAIGALFGAVFSTAKISTEILHNYQQERIKINQMNTNLEFNRQRAGYSLTAGSIGENR